MATELEIYEEQLRKCREIVPKFNVKAFNSTWFGRLIKKIAPGAAGITIWNTIYADENLIGTERGAEMLAHEVVHSKDQHTWLILFPISYFLLLPVGPSLKAVWEWRGYREDLRWIREHPSTKDPGYQEYMEDYYCQWVAWQFSSPMYLWMWPFKTAMYNKAKRFMASLPKI